MNKKHSGIERAPSSNPVEGQPETALDLINKYGTYEIQPTADTDNEYPAIAQGKYKDMKDISRHNND